MFQPQTLNLQYITDNNGKKTAVIIPIDQFEELLEDIEDLQIIATRKEEETISHEDLINELKQDGLLENYLEKFSQKRT